VAGVWLEAAAAPRLVLDPAALVAFADMPAPERQPAGRRTSVLIVDDSLTTRMLEQSILESAGYDVSVAASGEEGLVKARAGDYALFLVDVEMPGMDGFTFVEQVRADPILRGTPVILVTSRASADDRRRGREAGAQGHIAKGDFDQAVLLEEIRALVR
jgi:two-component system chemotaxis sensor kinase CheA